MRKMVSMVLLGASMLAAGAANAQSYGGGFGGGYGYGGDGTFRAVCSGARAHWLEERLRHEVDEQEIGRFDAVRIHRAIDALEDRQRHECAEGDRRSVYDIAQRYNGIGQWIDREAHGGYHRW